MTYSYAQQQELEAEWNGRIDYRSELAASAAGEYAGYDYGHEALLDARDAAEEALAALIPHLDISQLERLTEWAEAQTPEATEEAQDEQEGEKPDFTCDGCNRDFYHPHEGLFMGRNEEAFCLDCYLKNA